MWFWKSSLIFIYEHALVLVWHDHAHSRLQNTSHLHNWGSEAPRERSQNLAIWHSQRLLLSPRTKWRCNLMRPSNMITPTQPILGFHPRDFRLDDGCYPPCWCPNTPVQQRDHSEKVSVTMVLCVVFGCGSRSDRDKGIGFYRIPSVATNKGEFEEELTTERIETGVPNEIFSKIDCLLL